MDRQPSSEAAGSGDPLRSAEPRQRAGDNVHILFAKESAAVAKAEWVTMLEANRKLPGTVRDAEVQRAKRNYELALLKIEQSEQDKTAAQAEIKALEKAANDLRVRYAAASAKVAKLEYDKMLESNRLEAEGSGVRISEIAVASVRSGEVEDGSF